jgi:SAM-dependent methyltransferase
LAEQLDWGGLFQEIGQQREASIRLLDVACGSGQFPSALRKYGGLDKCEHLKVDYSLLDPSAFSIRVARQQLADPFRPAEEYLCTAQQFIPPEEAFSIVWATHALYCVPQKELPLALERILAALDPAGLGFIAHAGRHSHYLQFHDLYLSKLGAGRGEPFCSGEEVIAALRTKVDASALSIWSIDYEGTLSLDDRETVEGYLQRCLFDDTISLESMLADDQTGDYLRGCIDGGGGIWRFPQRVWLIFFGGLAEQIRDWSRLRP